MLSGQTIPNTSNLFNRSTTELWQGVYRDWLVTVNKRTNMKFIMENKQGINIQKILARTQIFLKFVHKNYVIT